MQVTTDEKQMASSTSSGDKATLLERRLRLIDRVIIGLLLMTAMARIGWSLWSSDFWSLPTVSMAYVLFLGFWQLGFMLFLFLLWQTIRTTTWSLMNSYESLRAVADLINIRLKRINAPFIWSICLGPMLLAVEFYARWRFQLGYELRDHVILTLIVFVFFLLWVFLFTRTMYLIARMAITHHGIVRCLKCGYPHIDLNEGTDCPECGYKRGFVVFKRGRKTTLLLIAILSLAAFAVTSYTYNQAASKNKVYRLIHQRKDANYIVDLSGGTISLYRNFKEFARDPDSTGERALGSWRWRVSQDRFMRPPGAECRFDGSKLALPVWFFMLSAFLLFAYAATGVCGFSFLSRGRKEETRSS